MSRVAVAFAAVVFLFGSQCAGNAAADPFGARLAQLAKLAETEGVGAGLREVAETPALADLGTSLPGTLGKGDKHLLELVITLTSPRMSRIHESLSSHKRLAAADRKFLGRIVRQLGTNPAVAELRRRGIALKHDPAELENLWQQLPGSSHPSGDLDAAPGRAPIEEVVAAVNRPMHALGDRSIAARGAALLASRAGYRYIRRLPPIALAMLFPKAGPGPNTAHSSGICASGSIGPSVTTILDVTADVVLGDVVAEATQKAVGKAVYWDAAFGRRALAWKVFAPLSRLKGIYESVANGEKLAEAAWNAMVKCGAKLVKIVPEPASRAAGIPQSFSLLAEDKKGTSWGGIRIDTLRMSGGSCDIEMQACYGKVVGDQSVVATFGNLGATGRFKVTPGAIAHLDLDPNDATIDVGEESPTYRVYATDSFGNLVTTHFGTEASGVHLEISPDGTCNQATGRCSPGAAGNHFVEAVTNATSPVISSARLNVRAGKLVLTPASATIKTGETQGYTAKELTLDGVPVRSVAFGSSTNQATLSISPDGSCDQAAGTCAPSHSGPHVVTAKTPDTAGQATLEVEPRELKITPTSLEAAVPTRDYEEVLEMVGAEGEVDWQISGSPPNGIEFRRAKEFDLGNEPESPVFGNPPEDAALLIGSPVALGTGTFTVTAQDAAGNFAHRTFGITSKAPCAGRCAEAGPYEQVTVAWPDCQCGVGSGNYYYLRPIVSGTPLEQYIWAPRPQLYSGPEGRVWVTLGSNLIGHAGTHVGVEISYGPGPPAEELTWEEFVETLQSLGNTNSVTVRR